MLDRTPLKDIEPFDLVSLAGIDSWMYAVTDIYAIEHDYDNEHDQLNALKKYISRSTPKDHTFLALFVFGEIPDSWTYVELRTRLLTIIAKGIANSYKKSQIKLSEYRPTQIQQFFKSIQAKQYESDKGQDVTELCEKYDVEWDTIKNFKRHDDFYDLGGIVKSKTDKLTKITYIYRDPNKKFYKNMNYNNRDTGNLFYEYLVEHNIEVETDDLLPDDLLSSDLDLDSFD